MIELFSKQLDESNVDKHDDGNGKNIEGKSC